MASEQTANFGLNQWAAEDRVMRTEFNADNAKIDAALGAIPKIVTGTYTGDGTETRFIDLGFTPKALYVSSQEGMPYSSSGSCHYGGLALQNAPVTISSYTVLKLEETGFWVYYKRTDYYFILTNNEGKVYYYVAIG